MSRAIVASALRLVLVAGFVGAVFAAVVGGLGALTGAPTGGAAMLIPFLAAALSLAGLGLAGDRLDRIAGRWAPPTVTRYSALAEAAARLRAESWERAMPDLARVLAEGTGARRAEIWLAVRDQLLGGASHPPRPDGPPPPVDNLAVLLARPDTTHVVPVLDGPLLRAALVIEKPDRPLTTADQQLMRDVAHGAGMLLRGVALNAELAERVRRADELAEELRASRRRLAQAREVERRRLLTELDTATTARLAGLRHDLDDAGRALDAIVAGEAACGGDDADGDVPRQALERARVGLDELLERFRVIARGVYPAVLRDQGPYAALDELATDMPRPVLLTGGPAERLAWELESGIYYMAASVMQRLADRPAEQPLRVALAHAEGRLSIRVEDPSPTASVAELDEALTRDVDRLAALGGAVSLEAAEGVLVLRAWLPDHLTPSVELLGEAGRAGAGTR
jgi:hypothetical protein